jgi:hypothetical protein
MRTTLACALISILTAACVDGIDSSQEMTGGGGKADGTGECTQQASGLYPSAGKLRAVLNFDCELVIHADYRLVAGSTDKLELVPDQDLFELEGERTRSQLLRGTSEDGSMTYEVMLQDGDVRTGASSARRAVFAVVESDGSLDPDSTGFLFFDDANPTRAGMYYGLRLPLPTDDFEAKLGKGEAHVVDEVRADATGDITSLTLRFGYTQTVELVPVGPSGT